jgi:thiol:disulfide interchange protein DsbA
MRIGMALAGMFVWAAAAGAQAQTSWVEGQQYFRVEPAQPTNVAPGQVEVLEVFSYGCPACNGFYPVIDKLKAQLPAKAKLHYLPASWHPEEGWKTFQRAFFAAEALGVAERTHDAIFDAIWKSGEIGVLDPQTHGPKQFLPTIVDVSKVYARLGNIDAGKFVEAAHSFAVDAKMREADAQIRAYGTDSTPTLIINGKYRLTPVTAGGNDQFIELAKFLVQRELGGKAH